MARHSAAGLYEGSAFNACWYDCTKQIKQVSYSGIFTYEAAILDSFYHMFDAKSETNKTNHDKGHHICY